jgi:hypothetical protein
MLGSTGRGARRRRARRDALASWRTSSAQRAAAVAAGAVFHLRRPPCGRPPHRPGAPLYPETLGVDAGRVPDGLPPGRADAFLLPTPAAASHAFLP